MTFYDNFYKIHTAKIERSWQGAYVVYIDNRFFCSADSYDEAEEEIDEYIKENGYKTVLEVL